MPGLRIPYYQRYGPKPRPNRIFLALKWDNTPPDNPTILRPCNPLPPIILQSYTPIILFPKTEVVRWAHRDWMKAAAYPTIILQS